MSALRDFMFERVYLGAGGARASTRKIEHVVRALFDHYCEHPRRDPAARPRRDDLATRVTDYLAGMTDRFCIRRFEALTVPRAFPSATDGPLHRRLEGEGPRRGRHDRARLRPHRAAPRRASTRTSAAARSTRSAPAPSTCARRRSTTTASAARCRATRSTFVMETEGLDFVGALESLAERFGVTLEVADEDPQAAERRERRDRLHALLDRAAAYYARRGLWGRPRRRRRGSTWPGVGCRRRC